MDTATAFAIFRASFTDVPSRRTFSTLHQAGPLPVVRSDYVWNGTRGHTDDFFIQGIAPDVALAAVRVYDPLPQHYLLVIDDQPDTLAAYTATGYRLAFSEYLMARSLDDLPPANLTVPVAFVRDETEAAQVNAADAETEPWVRPGNREASNIRHYYVTHDGVIAARARSWQPDQACSYVTHVFTHPAYRRRGLALAVMRVLLHDASTRGAQTTVLAATALGRSLTTAWATRTSPIFASGNRHHWKAECYAALIHPPDVHHPRMRHRYRLWRCARRSRSNHRPCRH
jgi:GNAT superfamily N-acetyltransferase